MEIYSKRKQEKIYAKIVHFEVKRTTYSFQRLTCKQYKCKSVEVQFAKTK